jgi:hypothetical protein
MGLTLEAEQALAAAKMTNFFDANRGTWTAAAKKAYDYAKGNFPKGSAVRPDDVAKFLVPILAVNERLKKELSAKRLRQKFWVTDFADLIIERSWAEISK